MFLFIVSDFSLSFRFIDEDRLNGRCEMTNLPTELSRFTDWDTSVAALFSVYIKHSYCPEARRLLQPATTPSSPPPSADVEGRILDLSPSGLGADFYPSGGSYYLQNNIFPDSRKRLRFRQQRGKWECQLLSSLTRQLSHLTILRCNLYSQIRLKTPSPFQNFY